LYITIKNKDLRVLKDSSTLDLAFYEIGNAMVQELRMGIIDQKASVALSQILQSLPDVMNVKSFETLKADKIQEIAKQSDLTFYDASYIALANSTDDEALTTDDSSVAKAARKMGIKTLSASDDRLSRREFEKSIVRGLEDTKKRRGTKTVPKGKDPVDFLRELTDESAK